MVWTLSSLIFAFSLLILKTILLDINSSGWTFTLIGKFSIINGILLIGTLSWIYFGYLIESADEKKKCKYSICKEIEKRNKNFYGQHLYTKNLLFIKREPGIKLFVIIKNLFIMFFLSLSFFVLYKSWNTDKQILLIILILAVHVIVFILYYIAQCIYIFIKSKRRG